MNIKRMGKILAFVVLAAAARGAYAVDYTLSVPVNVTNYSPTQSLVVSCYLITSSSASDIRHVEYGPRGAIAQATKLVQLTNGAYTGTLQLVFPLTPQQVGYAETYRCEFKHDAKSNLGNVAKPNSNSVMFVEGKVQ